MIKLYFILFYIIEIRKKKITNVIFIRQNYSRYNSKSSAAGTAFILGWKRSYIYFYITILAD